MENIKFNQECVHVVFLGVPNIPGIAAEIFSVLSEQSIEILMITQNTMRGGRSDLSFLADKSRLDEIMTLCRKISEKVEAQGVSFATEVSAITVGLKDTSEAAKILAKIFKALAQAKINIEIINSSSESVICIISAVNSEKALEALKNA